MEAQPARRRGATMTSPLIAVIDEDAALRTLLDDLLQDEGFRTILCATTCEGFFVVSLVKPDLIILDLWIEQPDAGWRLIQRLRRNPLTVSVPILVCSSDRRSIVLHERLLDLWGYRVLDKPFDI